MQCVDELSSSHTERNQPSSSSFSPPSSSLQAPPQRPSTGGPSNMEHRRPSQGELTAEEAALRNSVRALCYKTKFCPWFSRGRCNRGKSCNFAHNQQELQPWPAQAVRSVWSQRGNMDHLEFVPSSSLSAQNAKSDTDDESSSSTKRRVTAQLQNVALKTTTYEGSCCDDGRRKSAPHISDCHLTMKPKCHTDRRLSRLTSCSESTEADDGSDATTINGKVASTPTELSRRNSSLQSSESPILPIDGRAVGRLSNSTTIFPFDLIETAAMGVPLSLPVAVIGVPVVSNTSASSSVTPTQSTTSSNCSSSPSLRTLPLSTNPTPRMSFVDISPSASTPSLRLQNNPPMLYALAPEVHRYGQRQYIPQHRSSFHAGDCPLDAHHHRPQARSISFLPVVSVEELAAAAPMLYED